MRASPRSTRIDQWPLRRPTSLVQFEPWELAGLESARVAGVVTVDADEKSVRRRLLLSLSLLLLSVGVIVEDDAGQCVRESGPLHPGQGNSVWQCRVRHDQMA